MSFDFIAQLLREKSSQQILWLLVFTFFMALVNIVYKETKGSYQIFRQFVMSIGAAMLVGVGCYHLDLPFLVTILLVATTSFVGKGFWDTIIDLSKELPKVLKDLLLHYLSKGKK